MKTYKYIYLLCLLAVQSVGAFGQDTMLQPVDLGSKSLSFCYTDTKNTAQFLNDYVGRSTNDVYYKFSITVGMDITVSHCGSEVNDTYLTVLNESGTRIAYNDDYSGTGKCTNSLHSYIKLVNLTPGTYYVVSEGYSQNGNITTTIEGVKPLPATGLYDGSAVTSAANSSQNYIQTITPTVATSDVSGLGVTESLQSIQYFDGLGRPIETVQRGITPTKQDLATFTEYDGVGRDNIQWLPVPTTGNGAFTPKSAFTNGSSVYGGDSRPYVETVYEASPLNRITQKKGAGADWEGHPARVEYQTNDGTIAYYSVNGSNGLVKNSNYAANTLYVTQSKDEDQKITYEFKDKLNRVVLKRSVNDDGNVDTYYVYNDLGQLSYVIPPKAVDELTDLSDDNIVMKQLCYLYKYDKRGNCIQKRLPGCDWIYMVYDRADRLVLSQDGNQRPLNKWTVTKYDNLGRVLYTGITENTSSHSSLVESLSGQVLTESVSSTNNFNTTGYSCSNYVPESLLTVNYYDNYGFISNLPADKQSDIRYQVNADYDKAYPQTATTPDGLNAKGLLTGTCTYLLDNSGTYSASAMYYDYKGQVVQSRSTNHLGGYDKSWIAYNFSGKPTQTLKTHNARSQSVITELYTYTYDNALRPKVTTYSINGGAAIILSDMSASGSYDELGRLANKKRHGVADTESFSYNIRNWTTQISSGSGFTENIFYNSIPYGETGTPCYNGNIASTMWTYNGNRKSYSYIYDNLNRLTTANSFNISGITYTPSGYDESFRYDKMGNIGTLIRSCSSYGNVDCLGYNYNGNQINSIKDYSASHYLSYMTEYQDISSANNEMAYDPNGNLIKDLDRNIVTIRYNLLNLPEYIQFKNGNVIKNLYDAGGQKLRTDYYTYRLSLVTPLANGQVLEPVYTPTNYDFMGTAYLGNVEYAITKIKINSNYIDRFNNAIIYNPEGYITLSNLQYFYFRKDHLGSNREVWCATTNTTVQRTQYYPSGLPWLERLSLDVQNKKYNGKEFVEMHGLDETDLGQRGLHHAKMRFDTMDRFAEKYPWQSPYCMAANNPIMNIDLNGDSAWSVKREWNESDQKGFAEYAGKRLKEYEGKNIDCADLALSVIIDYASENGLALQISTADGTSFDSNSDNYNSVSDYKNGYKNDDGQRVGGVLPNVQATDISANTFDVNKRDAQSGDMIIMTKPANHIVNISQTSPNVKLTYGNIGRPVQTTADWSRYKNDPSGVTYTDRTSGVTYQYSPNNRTVHRWNFLKP